MSYLFTSEAVSEGHPDKVCDQISDALLDNFLAADPHSKVAIETLVTRGLVVLSGEVRSEAYVDLDTVVRRVLREIGYNRSEYGFDANSCAVLSSIHDQSPDINRGVVRANLEDQGAGDQGMMFGYATNETPRYMPLSVDVANTILRRLAYLRKEGILTYLRPDAKSQVTVEYSDSHEPLRIHTIVVSTQHDPFVLPKDQSIEEEERANLQMQEQIKRDLQKYLLPYVEEVYGEEYAHLFKGNFRFLVNPTGKFVLGGPAADTGLTGRKIIVDTYGGRSGHGGGAFSGKDPSKVDRSAAYMARYMAKNVVAAGVADEISIQIAYAIGEAQPVSLFVNTFGTSHVALSDSEIADRISKYFDLRPYAIEQQLKLRHPIYRETAAYGHFGRNCKEIDTHYEYNHGDDVNKRVEIFTWEKLDRVEEMKGLFGLA